MSNEAAIKDAVLGWINAFFPATPAASFESLSDGHHFYGLLSIAAPYCFSAEDASNINCTENWILKKTNLTNLVRDMNRFGTVFLKASHGFDVVASASLLLDSIAKGESNDGLVSLAEYVVTMGALAGSSAAIEKLRGLTKERQMALNSIMKRVMTLHNFKKAVPPTSTTAAQQQISAAAAAAAANDNNSASSIGANNNNNSNNNNNNTNRFGGGFGGLGGGLNGGGSTAEDEDTSLLRGELNVLRNDLRDKTAALDQAESKCAVAEQQLEQLQSRYRMLLEESETRGETSKERELQKALTSISKKDEQIQQLNGLIADLEHKGKQLKGEVRAAQEEVERAKAALEAEKRRVGQLIEERSATIAEKSEVLNKLAMTEDRLKIVMKQRDDFESSLLKKEAEEHEAIRSDIANGGTAATLAALAAAVGADGLQLGSVADVAAYVRDLKARLEGKEGELEMLKKLTTANGTGGDGDGGGDDDSDRLSNGSMTQHGGAGGSAAINTSSASFAAAATAVQNTSTTSNTNAASAAAAAAAAASFEAELEALRSRLSDATASIKSLEQRLAEQREAHVSEVGTLQMQIKAAREEAAVEAAKGHASTAEAAGVELAEVKAANERLKKQIADLTESLTTQEEEVKATLARQEETFRTRFDVGRKAMSAEQAVVTSAVFHCGQRSLALQQRNLLGGAAVPHIYHEEGFSSLFRAKEGAYGTKGSGSSSISGDGSQDAESFLSAARLAGVWSTVRTGGVPANGSSSHQTVTTASKKRS